VLNIRFGPRPSHYAVSLLSAVAGAGFAMRQILLHIAPGDPGYGTALFGYHYYSWAFIGFAVAIVLSAIMLLFDGQFTGQFTRADSGQPAAIGWFGRAAVWLVIVLVALNVISALLECASTLAPTIR
jgi:hypothetical protein